MKHDWIKSTHGHGEVTCRYCLCTNRGAAAIGVLNADCGPKERQP